MQHYLPNIAVACVVLVLVVRRQLTARHVIPVRQYLIPLVLAIYGIGLVIAQTHGRVVDPRHPALGAGLLAGEMVLAVLLGLLRGGTMRVWRDHDGTAWCKGDGRTVAAWGLSIAVRLGIYALGAVLGVHSAVGTLLVFLAVTLAAQNVLVERGAAHAGPALSGPVLDGDA